MVFKVEDQERDRAEIFDALGHPTRISILRLLFHEALSFADLKKKTEIGSSGNLQHHLTKLDGLITTNEYGKYVLSDAGNDALFVMNNVEAVCRRGRRKLISDSRKSRMRLSTIVVALTLCLIVSTLYLSNINASLNLYATQTLITAQNQYVNLTQYAANLSQYVAQNQYVCDIMTGSLDDIGYTSTGSGFPIEIALGQSFNYTIMVFSSLNRPPISYSSLDRVTIVVPPYESNDSYYRQAFIKFKLNVWGTDPSNVSRFHLYPIAGPVGWNGEVVAFPRSDVPPYPTAQTEDVYSPSFSGGVATSYEFIIPIETFGNYTFHLENLRTFYAFFNETSGSTITMEYAVETPVISLVTKPLQEYTFPTTSHTDCEGRLVHSGERIVQIRQQSGFTQPSPDASTLPTDIPDETLAAFNTATLAIFSATILGILSIFTINRKKMWLVRSDNAG
jgi:DNA-binding transcriptional ArsR family regulator